MDKGIAILFNGVSSSGFVHQQQDDSDMEVDTVIEDSLLV